MKRRILEAASVIACAAILVSVVSGCKKSENNSLTGASVKPDTAVNMPPAVEQRRAAEAQGRAEDAKHAAASAGAKLRQ